MTTYASITSYQDTGEIRSNWVNKPTPDELKFTMFYREPDRIRLEWIDHHPYPPLRYLVNLSVVWSTGRGVFYFWDEHTAIETFPDVPTAMFAVQGVSKRLSATVPALLVDGMRTPPPRPFDDLLLLEPDVFEGVPCYRVKGHRDDETYEIWVGRDDFLIRRVVVTPPPGFLEDRLLWDEEVHRDIRVDRPIADALFDYQPPPICTADPWDCP